MLSNLHRYEPVDYPKDVRYLLHASQPKLNLKAINRRIPIELIPRAAFRAPVESPDLLI
jgi:hypothetical protein